MPTPPFNPSQIVADIIKAYDFVFAYRRSQYPFTLNTATTNRIHFHNPLSKFLPYPLDSGSAYIQAFLAKVVYQIYGVTGNTTHRDRAGDLINALLFYFYKNAIPPSEFSDYWLPNAYVNANDFTPVTTMGNQANGTPFNYGYFDVAIAFTNGVAVLDSDLAYVYSVYASTNKLVIENVHAPTLLDNNYAIDYFVVNYNLKGAKYKIYSDLRLEPTSESAGTIKLTTNYSGTLKVTYTRYNGATVERANAANNGTGFLSINPVWFKDQDSVYLESNIFYAAYDAFKTAFQYLGHPPYDLAATHTKKAFLKLLNELQNTTYIYKTEGYPNPLRYPGSKAVCTLASTELTQGSLLNYLKLQGNTVEFYNFLVQAEWNQQTLLSVDVASSVPQVVDIYVTDLPNTSINYDMVYRAKLLLNGDSQKQTNQFGLEDFRKFVNGYYYLASESSFLTTELKGNGLISQQIRQIEAYYSSTLSNLVIFNRPTVNDDCRLLLTGNFEFPFNIRYSSSTPLRLRVKDENNLCWYAEIPKTEQQYYAPDNTIRDKVFYTLQINNNLFSSKSPTFSELSQVNLPNFGCVGVGKLSKYDDFGAVFYDPQITGEVKIVLFQGSVVSRIVSGGFFIPKEYNFVDVGDFDGDGQDELLFVSTNYAPAFRPVIRDLNDDGSARADFILPIVGSTTHWDPQGWTLKGAFKARPNKCDLLWYNYQFLRYHVWRIENNSHTTGNCYDLFDDSLPTPQSAWILKDIVDFNGDGFSDLIFLQEKTDEDAPPLPNIPRIAVLKSDGNRAFLDKFIYYPQMPSATNTDVYGVWFQYLFSGKLNLDETIDIFWINRYNNQIYVWFLDEALNIQDTMYLLGSIPPDYFVVDIKDLNSDGFNDVLWTYRSGNITYFKAWYLDGFTNLFDKQKISEIAIEPLIYGNTEVLLDYIGKPPATLEVGSKTYRHGIKETINTPHSLWIGNCYILNNQLVDNKYFKSCLPRNIAIAPTNKLKSHDGVICLRNQSPYHCTVFGANDAYLGQSDLINNAFKDYFADTGGTGFTPYLINTSFWDSADYVRYGRAVRQRSLYKAAFPIPFLFKVLQTDAVIYFLIEDNEFVWSVENSESAYNQYKPLESLAKDLYLNRSENPQFKNILSSFLRHILAGLASNNNRPYTTYKQSGLPTVDYTDPGLSGLIGKIALYCNLAFLEVEATIEIMQRCYDFLRSQFISDGAMSGTWSANQPNFTVGSVTYKEYNLEWHCEIIDFLTLCHKYQNEINFPYESPEGIYPAIPITRINEIVEPPYGGNKLTADDGSTQKQLKHIQYVGLEIEIYYERINDLALNVLSDFWIAIGGRAGTFSLPDLPQFADYRNNGEKFRFLSAPQFETFLANRNIGLYNCTIRIQLVGRN